MNKVTAPARPIKRIKEKVEAFGGCNEWRNAMELDHAERIRIENEHAALTLRCRLCLLHESDENTRIRQTIDAADHVLGGL